MGTIKTVFAVIDAAIQRKFDAAVFFLMRTFGCQKSIIRYAIWAIMITSIVGDLCIVCADNPLPVSSMVVVIAIMALLVGAYFQIQMRDYRNDRKAEAKGMRSRSDIFNPVVVAVAKGYFYYLLIQHLGEMTAIFVTTNFLEGGYAKLARELPETVFELSFLSILYLVRTPPVPPPREEKLKVLVPASEHQL